MYVDGYVFPVPVQNRERFIAVAREAAQVFLDHGATRVVENWGDDVPEGTHTSYRMAVKQAEDEVVCFSWIEYPDKATRDACHKTSMEDPRFAKEDNENRPFNGKHMVFAGFTNIVDMS